MTLDFSCLIVCYVQFKSDSVQVTPCVSEGPSRSIGKSMKNLIEFGAPGPVHSNRVHREDHFQEDTKQCSRSPKGKYCWREKPTAEGLWSIWWPSNREPTTFQEIHSNTMCSGKCQEAKRHRTAKLQTVQNWKNGNARDTDGCISNRSIPKQQQ